MHKLDQILKEFTDGLREGWNRGQSAAIRAAGARRYGERPPANPIGTYPQKFSQCRCGRWVEYVRWTCPGCNLPVHWPNNRKLYVALTEAGNPNNTEADKPTFHAPKPGTEAVCPIPGCTWERYSQSPRDNSRALNEHMRTKHQEQWRATK